MPSPGMKLHQNARTPTSLADQSGALLVTINDATDEPYSMFFAEQAGTQRSLRGVIPGRAVCSAPPTATRAAITPMPGANRHPKKVYLARSNKDFAQLAVGVSLFPFPAQLPNFHL